MTTKKERKTGSKAGRKRAAFEAKSVLRQNLEARDLARKEGNSVKKLLLASKSAAKVKGQSDLVKVRILYPITFCIF